MQTTEVLPNVMAGFRRRRGRRDCIADLATTLEEARIARHPAYAVLFDIYRAFDALPTALYGNIAIAVLVDDF